MQDAEYGPHLADKHFEQARPCLAAPQWVEVGEVNEPVFRRSGPVGRLRLGAPDSG
jgi:hypothetical protein